MPLSRVALDAIERYMDRGGRMVVYLDLVTDKQLTRVVRTGMDDLVKKYVDEKGEVTLSNKSVAAWQGLCATAAAAKTIKSVADLTDPEKTKVLDTDGDGRGEMWIGSSLKPTRTGRLQKKREGLTRSAIK